MESKIVKFKKLYDACSRNPEIQLMKKGKPMLIDRNKSNIDRFMDRLMGRNDQTIKEEKGHSFVKKKK